MDRETELKQLLKNSNSVIVKPLIDKVLFLENQLEQLEKLPMIKFNPENPVQQKTTPAAKLYKEFLQQYTNVLKVLERTIGQNTDDGTSPLRKWAESRNVNI